jgi:hypothetical protein
VDALLDEDRVALIGPILAEVLRGFRQDAHADWVASALRDVRYLDLVWAMGDRPLGSVGTWRRAAGSCRSATWLSQPSPSGGTARFTHPIRTSTCSPT